MPLSWSQLASLLGPQGSQGPAGAAGSDGASAYELAVAEGFSGTLQQWLDSLVGPQGPEGSEGPAGQPPANTVLSDPSGISGAMAISNIVVVTESAYGALNAEADALYVVIADPEP